MIANLYLYETMLAYVWLSEAFTPGVSCLTEENTLVYICIFISIICTYKNLGIYMCECGYIYSGGASFQTINKMLIGCSHY